MKKIMLSLGLMLGALTLTNCSNEIDENINTNTDGVAFELTAAIDANRTVANGFKTTWAANDAINLFHAVAGATTYTENPSFAIAEEDLANGRFTGTLSKELTAEAYDWYAFYPYNSSYTTPAGTRYYKLWQQTQSVEANSTAHVVGLNGPLYGVAENVAVGDPVKVQMHQLGTLLRVKVGNESGEDFIINSIKVAAANTYITGSFYVGFNKNGVSRCEMSGANYANQDVTLNVTDEYTIADGDDASDHCFYAAVAPFTAPEGGEILTITVVTDKGTYETTKDIPAGAEFASGVVNSLVVTVDNVGINAKAFPYEEDFYDGVGDFTIDNVAVGSLSTIWKHDSYGYMKGSGYNAGAATEGWLISPYVDLTGAANPVLRFDHAGNYFGSQANMINAVSVYVREADGEWAALTIPVYPNGTSWTFVNSDDIALSAYVGKTVQFGFKYTSPASGSVGTWEVKNVKVIEAPFAMSVSDTTVALENTASEGTIEVTTKNADGYTITAALKEASEWLSVSQSGNVITYSATANSGNERSAIIVVTATNGTETQTIDILVTQAQGESAAAVATATIDLTAQSYINQQVVTSATSNGFTVTFDKGTNSNAPKYYTSGSAVRVYGGGYFVIDGSGKTITKVELTFGTNDGSNAITSDVGTYASGTWNGSASSVKFTVGGTSGHRRIQKITITYIAGETTGPVDQTLAFNNTTATATVGQDFTEPTLSGAQTTVSYTSSNTAVATVDATTGEVTLVAAGETTITATAAANDEYNEATASYELTVNAAPAGTVDVLNYDFIGISGTSYTAWTKTSASGTEFAGQSAAGNNAIQLRSSNSNSGIVITKSNGKTVKKISVVKNSSTAGGRELAIYAQNTPFTSPTEMYGSAVTATKLGVIALDSQTEFVIEGDYEYIGVRSALGAQYLDSITITYND